ncbi:MAG: sigma-54-dependent transcriptional regulator [Planctomycetota bacterium]
MSEKRILIVDDDPSQAEALARILAMEGYATARATRGREALQVLGASEVHLVLADLKMPEMNGIELYRRIRDRTPNLPVVIVTAHGTIETAIEAVREGVSDYVQKPIHVEDLLLRFRRIFRESELRNENVALKQRLLHRGGGDSMLGGSPVMERLREQIRRVAPTEATVLVLGESGVGKELVADAIHYGSARAEGPQVKMNCAAVPDNLLEDELFGHERGAYTGAASRRAGRFERAHGGTLFLDEIGDLPLGLQAKLLRVLQEQTFERLGGSEPVRVDVRLLCATHQDLEALVGQGRFREDLYYRIHVVPLQVPPLRERREDIPLLASHFAREAGRRNGRVVEGLETETEALLASQEWPGNVRQLRNVIERAIVLGSGPRLRVQDLGLGSTNHRPESPGAGGEGLIERLLDSRITFSQFERELLTMALVSTHGNQSRAARMLGMTRRTLQYRIDKFSIDTAAMKV